MLSSNRVAACVVLLWSSDRLALAVRLVSITFTGDGVDVNLVRIGEDGADFDLYNCSQKLVRSDTGKRLPDRRCLGGSADSGLEPNMEGG
jgi:hypothetical protein